MYNKLSLDKKKLPDYLKKEILKLSFLKTFQTILKYLILIFLIK